MQVVTTERKLYNTTPKLVCKKCHKVVHGDMLTANCPDCHEPLIIRIYNEELHCFQPTKQDIEIVKNFWDSVDAPLHDEHISGEPVGIVPRIVCGKCQAAMPIEYSNIDTHCTRCGSTKENLTIRLWNVEEDRWYVPWDGVPENQKVV